ncbi:MAG: NifB/NifX family molybdenum-iron cluster-binding protein [Spirochaetota bacterium]
MGQKKVIYNIVKFYNWRKSMIALSSTDGTLDGRMDERFGRAKKFVIYNSETQESKVIDNKLNMDAPQGAGIQTAQNVINAGAKIVISGHMGPNAFKVLAAAGIEAYVASDMTCSEALKAFKEGKLIKLTDANVSGHWI